MKLLIYSVNYAPERTGIGKYSGEMAAWFAARGHSVRVVVPPPYYPEWKIAPSHRGRLYSREMIDKVQVWRTPLWVPSEPGGLKRVLHLLSFAASSLPVMLLQAAWRPDAVLVVAPAFVCTPGALVAARVCGAKSWLHVQDFEVDVAFSQGLLKGKWLRRVVGAGERWLFQRFDRVSSISNRMVARARDKGVDARRLVFFPNWVDVEAIKPMSAQGRYRVELGIPADAVVALFSGSLGRKQGLLLLPAAAKRLASFAKLVIVICGDGALKQELEVAASSLPNMRLLPLQPVARLGELLSMADIHLLPQSPEAADLVMPSKLSGMLASGRPVVATTAPGTEIATALEHCGVIVPPDDLDAFANAIEMLARDPELRRRLGLEARRFAERCLGTHAVLSAVEDELAVLIAS